MKQILKVDFHSCYLQQSDGLLAVIFVLLLRLIRKKLYLCLGKPYI